MFEFKDEKLGNVKVVNVTEARSSIAALMNDRDFNYIITKNNKPIRVVVNFETFKKGQMEAQTRSKKPVDPKPSLQGLIEAKEKELKRQVAQTPERSEELFNKENPKLKEEELPLAVNDQRLPIPPSTGKINQEPPVQTPKEEYFLHSKPQEEAPSTELPPEKERDRVEVESPFIEAPSQPIEKQVKLTDQEVQPVDKQVQITEEQTQVTDKPIKAGEEETGDQTVDDYFNRFKELYESAPRYEGLYQNNSSKEDETSFEVTSPIEEAPSMPSPDVVFQTIEPETREDAAVDPHQRGDEFLPEAPAEGGAESIFQEALENRSESGNEPPSIQDILKDLENEKLTGEEEENLDSDQINQMINRFTRS